MIVNLKSNLCVGPVNILWTARPHPEAVGLLIGLTVPNAMLQCDSNARQMRFNYDYSATSSNSAHELEYAALKRQTWCSNWELLRVLLPLLRHVFKGLRPILHGGICCNNARGCAQNKKSNVEAVKPQNWTYCSHKSECIVTTNPDRSVSITIITWHSSFHPVNITVFST